MAAGCPPALGRLWNFREESGRRCHDDLAGVQIDGGDDGTDERNLNNAIRRTDGEAVLSGSELD